MIKVAMFPNASAARYWRLEDPAKYLNRLGGFEVRVIETGINEEVANWADIYVLQGCIDQNGIALLYAYQQEFGKKIVVDSDDYLKVQADNPHKLEHDRSNAVAVVKRTMQIADGITVTNEYLRQQYLAINPNICVLPNFMDLERWDMPILKNESSEIRIGWAGSMTHLKDVGLVRKALIDLMIDYPKAKLILMGDPRLKRYFDGLNVEVILGVPFEAYPSKLRSLRLDVGIAPIRDVKFNRFKSPIKAMEYGIMGVPVVASNIPPYSDFIEDEIDGYLARRDGMWLSCIESIIEKKEIEKQTMVDAMRKKIVGQYDLSKNIHMWADFYKSL